METRTLTLSYEVGTTFEAIFEWTVTNVIESGTFVDGTPWVVVGSGAELIDVSPRSILTQTTNMLGANPGHFTNGQTANVYINGTVKNFKARQYRDPDADWENDIFLGNPGSGYTGPNKNPFDSRYTLTTRVNSPTVLQDLYDDNYDLSVNIGYTATDGPINPVGLTYGDVIITAKSQFHDHTIDPYPLGFVPGKNGGLTAPQEVPNVYYDRTPILRYGILTVLQTGITQESFRPPAQWYRDDPQSRPLPIPVSSALSLNAIPEYLKTNEAENSAGISKYATSLTLHDGSPEKYQSTNATRAIKQSFLLAEYKTANVYYGSGTSRSIFLLLYQFLNTRFSDTLRLESRNKFIQYAIDAYGAAVSLVHAKSGAGQRSGELKPFILAGGYLLNNSDMINIYDTIRTVYSGNAIASYTDEQIGRHIFFEDATYSPVRNHGIGSLHYRTFSPDSALKVINAEEVPEIQLMNLALDNNGTTKFILRGNKFGKVYISSFYEGTVPGNDTKSFWRVNYFGSYLKITDGPGAGDTLYKIIDTGRHPGKSKLPGQYIIVDRPWINGTPTHESTIKLFPLRDGVNGVDGSTADIGRLIFQHEYGTTLDGKHQEYNISPISHQYGAQTMLNLKVQCPFLIALTRETGLTAYCRGNDVNYFVSIAGGISADIANPTHKFGNVPVQERFTGVIFDLRNDGFYLETNKKLAGSIEGISIYPENFGISFDEKHGVKMPGYDLTYNATAITKVLDNWGNPGGSDFNGDGVTDSSDLAFILRNFGS